MLNYQRVLFHGITVVLVRYDMLSSTCEVTAARAHGVHVTCSLQSLVLSLWYSNMAITKSIKILYKLCLFYVFYGKIWEHHL